MHPTRRQLLATAAAATLVPTLSIAGEKPPARPPLIGVSSYSFWQFKNDDLRDLESNIELAGEIGATAGWPVYFTKSATTTPSSLSSITKTPGNAVGVPFRPTDGTPLVALTCGGIVDLVPRKHCLEKVGPDLVSMIERLRAKKAQKHPVLQRLVAKQEETEG